MTKPIPGKLQARCPDMPIICDICKRSRAHGNHQKCSKIRQQRHAKVLLDDEFDRMLMFDKVEG